MDTREATALLRDHLDGYRRRTYGDLVGLRGKPQIADVRGGSGNTYHIEVEVHWESRPGGAIRVLGSVDDGGLRFIKPISQDFILAPDGTFVGE